MNDAPGARIIATARDYGELIKGIRAYVESIGASRASIDELSGLPAGYTSTLLATSPARSLGRTSMGPLLGALGLMLLIATDPQTARNPRRMPKRNESQVRHRHKPAAWLFTPERAREARSKAVSSLTPARRRQIARRAIRARWKRAREQKLEQSLNQ